MNTKLLDDYLKKAMDNNAPMIIYLMNGFQMRGTIIGADDLVVVIVSNGREQAVFKHTISTVAPFIEGPAMQKEMSAYRAWQGRR